MKYFLPRGTLLLQIGHRYPPRDAVRIYVENLLTVTSNTGTCLVTWEKWVLQYVQLL